MEKEFQKNYNDNLQNEYCQECKNKLEYRYVTEPFSLRVLNLSSPSYVVMPCRICAEKEEKLKLEEERKRRNIELIAKLINTSGIPIRFKDKNFSNFLPNELNQIKIFTACKQFVENFNKNTKQGMNLIFIGNYGTGKTHLAVSIAVELINHNIPCIYAKVPELFRKIKSTFNKQENASTQDDILTALTRVDLLILDEIGFSLTTNWERLTLCDILTRRFDMCKSTILISNLEFQELSNTLGERVIDRFYEDNTRILIFDWESYRRNSLTHSNQS